MFFNPPSPTYGPPAASGLPSESSSSDLTSSNSGNVCPIASASRFASSLTYLSFSASRRTYCSSVSSFCFSLRCEMAAEIDVLIPRCPFLAPTSFTDCAGVSGASDGSIGAVAVVVVVAAMGTGGIDLGIVVDFMPEEGYTSTINFCLSAIWLRTSSNRFDKREVISCLRLALFSCMKASSSSSSWPSFIEL